MKQCGVCGNLYDERASHCSLDGSLLTTAPPSEHQQHNQVILGSTAPLPPQMANLDLEADERTEVMDAPLTRRSEDLSGKILNNTYRLEQKIGHGGMGAVYKATHLKIGDLVAIKFIAPELASNPTLVMRFQREALAARKLSHPDAITVYEMGEADGLVYIVMQYVEGERFDKYLERVKSLPARRVVHLLRCIVDVLDTAHRVGIVHRDLKPANLMLYTNSRGMERVKVLDFGIAKLYDSLEDFEEMAYITQKGDIFGSPFYMSPEQAMGGNVDARTDIYSLGVITYQMVTGKLPFDGKTGHEVIEAHLSKPPVPPTELIDTDIEYDDVILKALAKEPEDRYTSVTEFLAEFEALLPDLSSPGLFFGANDAQLFGVASEQMSIVVPGMSQPSDNTAVTRGSGPLNTRLLDAAGDVARVSLAILPLKCLSADEQARMLSVGLADTLISELAVVRDLIVRPIRAVLKYENTDVDLITAGRQLDVDFLVDGSVQSSGQRVRVSFRLVDIKQNQDVWQDRFDMMGDDPFIIQDKVSRRIVESLRINLTDYEKERFARVPQQMRSDVQEYYIRGRYFFERAIELQDLELAIQMFEQAIELDTGFARAYTGLAQCHYIIQTGFDDISDHIVIAEGACRKAMTLDPLLADAYSTLASIYMDMGRREDAPELVNKALALSPNNLEANLCIGWYYRVTGQLEKSLSAYKRALRSDPTFWRSYWGIAMANIYQGFFNEAEKVADTYLKSVDPRHPVMLYLKGLISVYQNRLSEAEALGLKLRHSLPNLPCGSLLLAQVYATRQEIETVEAQLATIKRRFGPKEDLYYWYAQIYARCGQVDHALDYLERSIEAGNENFNWFRRDPALSRLHSPAFDTLLAQFSRR